MRAQSVRHGAGNVDCVDAELWWVCGLSMLVLDSYFDERERIVSMRACADFDYSCVVTCFVNGFPEEVMN